MAGVLPLRGLRLLEDNLAIAAEEVRFAEGAVRSVDVRHGLGVMRLDRDGMSVVLRGAALERDLAPAEHPEADMVAALAEVHGAFGEAVAEKDRRALVRPDAEISLVADALAFDERGAGALDVPAAVGVAARGAAREDDVLGGALGAEAVGVPV